MTHEQRLERLERENRSMVLSSAVPTPFWSLICIRGRSCGPS
jgi:hypothetical protein